MSADQAPKPATDFSQSKVVFGAEIMVVNEGRLSAPMQL
jgi:hypothetical protein